MDQISPEGHVPKVAVERDEQQLIVLVAHVPGARRMHTEVRVQHVAVHQHAGHVFAVEHFHNQVPHGIAAEIRFLRYVHHQRPQRRPLLAGGQLHHVVAVRRRRFVVNFD